MGVKVMSDRWKNLYPGELSRFRIDNDNSAVIYELVESLLDTVDAYVSRTARTETLEAFAIAKSVLTSLEDHGEDIGIFRDDEYQDINGSSFKSDRNSKAFRL